MRSAAIMTPTMEAKAIATSTAEVRWLAAARLPAPWAGLVVTLGFAASYWAINVALDIPFFWADAQEADPRLDGNVWSAATVSALLGFGFAAQHYVVTLNSRDVATLASAVPDTTPEALRDRWLAATLGGPGLRSATTIGLVLGLATWSIPLVRYVLPDPTVRLITASTWFLVTVPLLYVGFMRAAWVTTAGIHNLPRDLEIDLLDHRALAPFARIGLRNALVWTLAGTLLLTLVVSIPLRDLLTTAPAVLVIVALAASALVVPARKARNAILQVKQRELLRANAELRTALEDLRAGRDEGNAAARVQALAAWRQTVESANEWPLDAPTLVRFLLYLVIPVAGWLAGALVERWVDAVLG